jgi:hypothetical protein
MNVGYHKNFRKRYFGNILHYHCCLAAKIKIKSNSMPGKNIYIIGCDTNCNSAVFRSLFRDKAPKVIMANALDYKTTQVQQKLVRYDPETFLILWDTDCLPIDAIFKHMKLHEPDLILLVSPTTNAAVSDAWQYARDFADSLKNRFSLKDQQMILVLVESSLRKTLQEHRLLSEQVKKVFPTLETILFPQNPPHEYTALDRCLSAHIEKESTTAIFRALDCHIANILHTRHLATKENPAATSAATAAAGASPTTTPLDAASCAYRN